MAAMRRILLSTIALVFILVPLALVAAVLLCLEDGPSVARSAELTPGHVEQAKRLLEAHDPRRLGGGGVREIRLSASELDLAANYLAHRYGGGSSARIDLASDTVKIAVSIELPQQTFGRFMNVAISLRESAGLPVLDALSIGRLVVPAWVGRLALEGAARAMTSEAEYRLVVDTIRRVAIDDGGLRVTYAWQEDLPDRLRSAALPPADRERLKRYHERLVQIVGEGGTQGALPLPRLLAPLAELAVERGGADPQAESRALIAVVAAYTSGIGITAFVPQAREWSLPARRWVTLSGRHDLAQHFTVSAALAAFAGSPLADAIGLYKEVEDSRGGSGFSFKDLAADRAGTVFGEFATRSADNARGLQRRLAGGATEEDMMPRLANLPEFLSEAQFRRRFGGVGEPAYENMMRRIERRIAACALYREAEPE